MIFIGPEIRPNGTHGGVAGAVGGHGDGQGPLGQRPGPLQLAQVLPDEGEVAQVTAVVLGSRL